MSLVSQVAEDGGGGAGRLVLFAGGDITDVFNDLYSLDMDTLEWRLCKTSGTPPAPRAGHCTEVLPDGVLLVWGGGGIERVYNDLHLLDPRTMSVSLLHRNTAPTVHHSRKSLLSLIPTPHLSLGQCLSGPAVSI